MAAKGTGLIKVEVGGELELALGSPSEEAVSTFTITAVTSALLITAGPGEAASVLILTTFTPPLLSVKTPSTFSNSLPSVVSIFAAKISSCFLGVMEEKPLALSTGGVEVISIDGRKAGRYKDAGSTFLPGPGRGVLRGAWCDSDGRGALRGGLGDEDGEEEVGIMMLKEDLGAMTEGGFAVEDG